MHKKKIVGIITARGGSKGILGKNIKELLGKPLIAYTIEAAKESGVFDRIILSTDDEKIAAVAKEYGCEIPFLRPAELAADTTPHDQVISHALRWLKDNENYVPDAVMILQPTAPLRTPTHIREAADLFVTSGADSVVSVAEIPRHFHPRWQLTIDDKNNLAIFTGEPFSQIVRRRQDLLPTYTRNGAIYLFNADMVQGKDELNFYGNTVAAYIMKLEESINIDTLEDWEQAEKIIQSAER